jgi:hypothetical protein
MVSRFVLSISTLILLAAAGGAGADTFRQIVADDGHVCNDTQYGPTQAYNTTALHVRSIASRRRVGYMKFDISALKTPGKMLSNVRLDLCSDGSGRVAIYGVIEAQEKITIPFTQLTWSMAPGVPNSPPPAVDSPVTLDMADLVGPLAIVQIPAVNARVTTDPNKAMDAFFNSDTNGSVLLLLAPAAEGQNALIWSVRRNTTDCAYLLGETVAGVSGGASNPSPADKATDVYVGAALSWTPGTYAAQRNVYFGTSLADVNTASADQHANVAVGLAQDANTYDPAGNLQYGQTYYWRVDEVNEVDGKIYRGNVWSFTAEPALYPVKGIVATASSSEAIAKPAQTVDGSGLTGDLHSTTDTTMWVSSKTGSQPTWIQYEFDKLYKLREMWVWNYNNVFESVLGFGFKDVTVEYSTNGTDWTLLKDVQFAQGTAQDGYAHNTTVDFGGIAAKSVRLTAKSSWAGVGRQAGLSEVRFLYVPTYASNPLPAAAQTGVSPDVELQWRSGREAASHQVNFGADKQAVTDGKALAGTTAQTSFSPGSLDLAKTYYWKVNEVNQATTPSTWPGEVWSFTTIGYLVVDDFESYTDAEGSRIYETWIDGYGTKTNGSQVGYSQGPFAERTTVHGGRQSMPLSYDNSTAAYSEGECTFKPAQDWTVHGVKTLSLWFYGPAANKGGQLYLKVNGTKVAYAGAAADLTKAQWVQWTVNLASLGVNQAKVTSLIIGVEGAGTSGVLFLDDLQLRP